MNCLLCDEAPDGLVFKSLCPKCAGRVLRDLESLQRSWLITEAPKGLSQSMSDGGKSSESPLPGSTDWLDFRHGADIRALIGPWVDQVRAENDLTPVTDRSVGSLLAWLLRFFDVAIGVENADFFALGLSPLAQRGKRLDGSLRVGAVSVPCPTVDCGATVRVIAANHKATASCRLCDGSWTTEQVVALALLSEVWVSSTIGAMAAGVSERTLRTWAVDGRITRENGQYWLPSLKLEIDRRNANKKP